MVSVPRFKKFLCCIELKLGSLIIGWTFLILSALVTILCIVALATGWEQVIFLGINDKKVQYILDIIIYICQAINNYYLIRGITTDNRKYVYIWIIFQCAFAIINIFGSIIILGLNLINGIFLAGSIVFIVSIILYAIAIYCILVVHSYYKESLSPDDV